VHDDSKALKMTSLDCNQLSDTTRQLELLVNSVTDYAIYMLDVEGIIRTWNPGGERIKGYVGAEVLGSHFSRFYPPDEVDDGLPQKNLDMAAAQGRFAAESWRIRKDGSRFRASIVIDPIWEDGRLLGYAKVTRDVSERYEAEQRLMAAQHALINSHKMEAVGKLTLGLAHDLNNLLTIIVNSLDIIEMHSTDSKIKGLVQTALCATDRGVLLTRQLLTFGRGQPLSPEPSDVNRLIADSADLLRRSAGEDILVRFEHDLQLPVVDIDRAQFEAALLNLVCNSRDAIPTTGEIRIVTSIHISKGDRINEQAAGTYVCVSVVDSGSGISEEHLGHVFDPFFTTKEVGRGSGLGLSQVFGFARQSGGFTCLETVPGSGTRVSICIPQMDARA
jgi:PAS domain S-box-containing protein